MSTIANTLKKMADHLAAQRRRSYQGNGVGPDECRYRDDQGGACVVGCLIPDAVYSPKIEDMVIRTIVDGAKTADGVEEAAIWSSILSQFPGADELNVMRFLTVAQNYHDTAILQAFGQPMYVQDILNFEGKTNEEFSAHIYTVLADKARPLLGDDL